MRGGVDRRALARIHARGLASRVKRANLAVIVSAKLQNIAAHRNA